MQKLRFSQVIHYEYSDSVGQMFHDGNTYGGVPPFCELQKMGAAEVRELTSKALGVPEGHKIFPAIVNDLTMEDEENCRQCVHFNGCPDLDNLEHNSHECPAFLTPEKLKK